MSRMLLLAAAIILLVASAGDAQESQNRSSPPLPSLLNCSTLKPGEEYHCPSNAQCKDLDLECLECSCPSSCAYGRKAEANCRVREDVPCIGSRTIRKPFRCQYCFQAEREDYTCEENYDCNSVAPPGEKLYIKTNCTVNDEVLCLGRRKFVTQRECNWTSGYKWSTALALSITLGGFGADRFYLGHWQEGIGKLFSFGGLGVWTLVDVVMVAIRYVGPSDGSLFI